MKKIIKFIVLVMVMFVGVFSLASCGENYSKYVEEEKLNRQSVCVFWFEDDLEKDCVVVVNKNASTNIKEVKAVSFLNKENENKEILKVKFFKEDKNIIAYSVSLKGADLKNRKFYVDSAYYISKDNKKLYSEHISDSDCPEMLNHFFK